MRFQIHFDRVSQASNNQGGRAVMRSRAPSLASPARKMVACLLAAALLPLAPGHARAAEPGAAADQDAPPESIAQASREPALTSDQALPERRNLHGQFTLVKQYHPSFTSPYEGPNSLHSARNGEETTDLTLFGAIRLWNGGAFYANPEIDQGFGLSDTLGIAGFPSGEAYKIGKSKPYFRLQRAFLRQVFDLGGASQTIDPGVNELGGVRSADNVTLTVGKFSVVDIFDTNSYAHDSRGDFLNWSVIDAAAFDYAADSWGYTVGAALEWTQSWWTLRAGFFDLSDVPNSKTLEPGFNEFALIGEFEGRYDLSGRPGKLKLLGFVNRARMGSYDDAIRLGRATGAAPETALVRRDASRPGMAVNLEQEITNDLGAFARISANDGNKEAYDFTDVNKSLSGGLVLKGNRWKRADDRFGIAAAVNGLSDVARRYFAAGGLGILIGDGQLPHYGGEYIVETFYSMRVVEHLTVSADYQYVTNPAYNRDRGPVSIFGVRVHAEF
jgi:high affinity Mn2+ porin